MNILLEISYLGTEYHGWQIQSGSLLRTVQGVLQDALIKLLGCEITVTGCSRTDAGVHANQFFCKVATQENVNIPLSSLPYAIQNLLPDDICVLNASYCDDDFHPRYMAKRKRYIYLMYDSQRKNPFYKNLYWYYPKKLNVELMNMAAKHFIGTYDFTSFCSSDSSVEDKTRTIYSLNAERDGNVVKITIEGNGFLYNMVRIIVGTLVAVSDGKISSDEIPNIISVKDRKMAGQTSPPHGLYLDKVYF